MEFGTSTLPLILTLFYFHSIDNVLSKLSIGTMLL
jgi:hypothetical protein